MVADRKKPASVLSLQLGTSSRVSTRRASSAVSSTAGLGQLRSWRAQAAFRKPMSKGALWATSTAPAANSRNEGSTEAIEGAVATIRSVIPVSTLTNGLIGMPGSTRVANSPITSPARTLTAPISVIESVVEAPPVVSRSTTTKVVASSGSSRQSRLSWPRVIAVTIEHVSDEVRQTRRAAELGCRPGQPPERPRA